MSALTVSCSVFRVSVQQTTGLQTNYTITVV